MAHERIEIDPEVAVGKSVTGGTHVTDELILRKLGAGMTPEEIIADHPGLTIKDVRAAQAAAPPGLFSSRPHEWF